MSGRYKAYGEYKESGVEWLGEIPERWICTQVKYGYDVTLGKMLQKTKGSSFEIIKPYLKAQNIQPTGIDLDKVDEMWFSDDERKKLLLRNNDVLVSEGGDVGRSALWKDQLSECYIQNAINRVRALKGNSSSYFNYWVFALKSADYINILCNKATIAHYTAEKLETTPQLLPTPDEQTQIATFLDHETAKIDTLIDKQQQLIELLKEKRQAVISHAVTKGLDPDVPMKDSGVKWLGEVPEHWDVIQLKYITSMSSEKIKNINDRYVGMENISSGNGKYIFKEEVVSDGISVSFNKGDVLFGKLRPYLAKSWVADFSGVCSSEFLVLRALKVSPYFLNYYLLTNDFIEQVNSSTYGSKMPRASWDFIGLLSVPICSYKTSEIIALYLDKITLKIDTLIELQQEQIELLKERRTALISAAVTGKIDVRDWQVPVTQTESDEVMA